MLLRVFSVDKASYKQHSYLYTLPVVICQQMEQLNQMSIIYYWISFLYDSFHSFLTPVTPGICSSMKIVESFLLLAEALYFFSLGHQACLPEFLITTPASLFRNLFSFHVTSCHKEGVLETCRNKLFTMLTPDCYSRNLVCLVTYTSLAASSGVVTFSALRFSSFAADLHGATDITASVILLTGTECPLSCLPWQK